MEVQFGDDERKVPEIKYECKCVYVLLGAHVLHSTNQLLNVVGVISVAPSEF